MKTTKFFVGSVLLALGLLILSCSNNSSNKKSTTAMGKNKFYDIITKSSEGDFRGYTLNLTTYDDVLKSEKISPEKTDSQSELSYKYQIDDYNRYDVYYKFEKGKLVFIDLSYYSYENDGNKAYQNGKELYDILFKEYTSKYGEPRKFTEQDYIWNSTSKNNSKLKVELMNKGREGESGTVEILFQIM